MANKRVLNQIAHNVYDDLAITYGELLTVRGKSCRHWPPGGGDRPKKLGPSCPMDIGVEDLLSQYREHMAEGRRLLRMSKKFVE